MLINGAVKAPPGCSCCNTRQERRASVHTAKRVEARAWKKDQGL